MWFKQGESWSSKYISYSSTIVFLAPSVFDLRFCNISRMSLDFTSFFSCCFFCCRDFPSACFPSSFANERKVPAISSFFGSIKSSKYVFDNTYTHRYHRFTRKFKRTLKLAHLQWLAVSHQQQQKKSKKKSKLDSIKLIPAYLFVNDHSRKLVPTKCNFCQPAKSNSREN